jgi:peptidoglycan/xylan/chitin deacetylase (PgdA/CDA1 family)
MPKISAGCRETGTAVSAVLSLLFVLASFAPAVAQQCADQAALGTSQDLTISPEQFKQVGTLQYKETLPLQDHEVVLTFDDGPLPPYTNIILDILKSQCVRANYFLIGRMANAFPYLVRRIYNDGHTVGTHTLNHPLNLERLPLNKAEHEINDGIAAVEQAMGDPRAVAPFFRIPGLEHSQVLDTYLDSRALVTWSTDVLADDWLRGITPDEIVERAMKRLAAKGKGILLLHDIHPATAMALPSLLRALKEQGYRVVHVVPRGELPKMVVELPSPTSAKDNVWPRLFLDNISNRALMTENNRQIKESVFRNIR